MRRIHLWPLLAVAALHGCVIGAPKIPRELPPDDVARVYLLAAPARSVSAA